MGADTVAVMSAGLVTSETVGDATGVTGDTVSIGADTVAVMSAGLVTSETVGDATGITGDPSEDRNAH